MICDNLSNSDKIAEHLPVKFKKAFGWIKHAMKDPSALKPGRFPINEVYQNMKAIIDINTLKAYGTSEYENHHEFIDIQVFVDGTEWIFWTKAKMYKVTQPYSKEKDIEFFESKDPLHESTCLRMEPGMFAIFYPTDWHMPSIAPTMNPDETDLSKKVTKIIIKVPVD